MRFRSSIFGLALRKAQSPIHQISKRKFISRIANIFRGPYDTALRIRQEWIENEKASRCIEDKEETLESTPNSKASLWILFQNPRIFWVASRSALEMHISTIFDPEESSARLKVLESQLNEKRNPYSKSDQKYEEQSKKVLTKLEAMESDLMEVTKRVRQLLPDTLPTNQEDAIKLAKAQKGYIQELAVDRLEVMAAAISEFMAGYRQGKADGIAHIKSPEGDKYFSSLEALNDVADKKDAERDTGRTSER